MLKRVVREDIRLECRYAAPLPFVQADPGMLEQVLLNLVVNARDAMPKGGQLLITTEATSVDEARRADQSRSAGRRVCLFDGERHGHGHRRRNICRGYSSRSSPPRKSARAPASGWRRSMASSNSTRAGSRSPAGSARARPSKSSCRPFRRRHAKTAAAQAGAELRGGTETILLVEDDEAVRLITRRVLERYGYTIWEACTAREAREVWRSHREEIALLLSRHDHARRDDRAGPGRGVAQRPAGVEGHVHERLQRGSGGQGHGVLSPDQESLPAETLPAGHTSLQTVRQCLDEK